MFKKVNIGAKVTAVVLAIVLVTVATVSFLTFSFSRKALEEKYIKNLSLISSHKASKIDDIFNKVKEQSLFISELQNIGELINNDSLDTNSSEGKSKILAANNDLKNLQKAYGYQNIFLYDEQGKLLADTKEDSNDSENAFQLEDTGNQFLSKSIKSFSVFLAPSAEKLTIGVPLKSKKGAVIFQLPTDKLYSLLKDTVGLGKTGETILIRSLNNETSFISPLRLIDNSRNTLFGIRSTYNPTDVSSGFTGFSYDKDYRKNATLTFWRPVSGTNWSLITKLTRRKLMRI